MNICKIAFSIILFFSLLPLGNIIQGAHNKRKPLLLVKPKTKKMKTQNNQASSLQPDEGLLATETKAIKSDDKKEEKIELKAIDDKPTTTNIIDIDSKFFETKDAIFELFPADEILQSDLKALEEYFTNYFGDYSDADSLNLNQIPNLSNLPTCRFISCIVKHMCKKARIQNCNIGLYIRHPINSVIRTKKGQLLTQVFYTRVLRLTWYKRDELCSDWHWILKKLFFLYKKQFKC